MGKKNRNPNKQQQSWHPKAAEQPRDRKFEVGTARPPEEPKRFSWSFASVDHDGPFGWDRCTSRADAKDVATKLAQFEGMNQNQLSRQGSHPIPIAQLCREAQDRLRVLKIDDIDELFSLRMTGRKRVFCRLLGDVMRILWWDPEHNVCPSNLTHT